MINTLRCYVFTCHYSNFLSIANPIKCHRYLCMTCKSVSTSKVLKYILTFSFSYCMCQIYYIEGIHFPFLGVSYLKLRLSGSSGQEGRVGKHFLPPFMNTSKL